MLAAGIGVFLIVAVAPAPLATAHDIPNQRVDRSAQATLVPGKLVIEYEVSLSELTLTQDLRTLVGSLPGGDRSGWFQRYGEVTGPLDAKGFLVACDGNPVPLQARGFEIAVEEHPRFTFHFEAMLPDRGRLKVHDTNYVSSEGTSRLAIRGRDGVVVEGDDLPPDVADIPIRPVWQLTDLEERRTKQVEITFRGPSLGDPRGEREHNPITIKTSQASRPDVFSSSSQLSRLLDRGSASSWLGLVLIAASLGAIHAIQPGHGKTLVSAIALGPEARWYQPALLGLLTTLAHTGSVLLIAAVLWWTSASRVSTASSKPGPGRGVRDRGRWVLEDRPISGELGGTPASSRRRARRSLARRPDRPGNRGWTRPLLGRRRLGCSLSGAGPAGDGRYCRAGLWNRYGRRSGSRRTCRVPAQVGRDRRDSCQGVGSSTGTGERRRPRGDWAGIFPGTGRVMMVSSRSLTFARRELARDGSMEKRGHALAGPSRSLFPAEPKGPAMSSATRRNIPRFTPEQYLALDELSEFDNGYRGHAGEHKITVTLPQNW